MEELIASPHEAWGEFYLTHCIHISQVEEGNRKNKPILIMDSQNVFCEGSTYKRYGTDFLDPIAEKVFYELGLIG